ncbi:AAA family ATPase [Vallitalea guaymasensis]|uniref:AAA family ATPase n=1 Tax=Vallitalea guaymasensis TaxID=1185412 RepID=UPI002353D338|nr:AAA family ATPase [Vallitalea guaymasensis]
MREVFKEWLRKNTDLAEGTIKSYGSAIAELSNWGIKEDYFITGLYDITNLNDLTEVIDRIGVSDLYKAKNDKYNRRWSSALAFYKQYLNSKDKSKAIYLKDRFQEWMSEQVQDNGKNYSEHTQKGYVRALQKACSEIEDLELESKDLFSVGSSRSLKSMEDIIRANRDFPRVNKKFGKGQLSAGIIKYTEFLQSLEKDRSSNDMDINNEFQKNAVIGDDNCYTKFDFLSEVFITDKEYEKMKSLLERKMNLIIQGAPGVGKTFIAERLAYSLIGEKDQSRVKMVQFHQSYSYEDFIMGYRPIEGGFELKKGIFYNFCERASKNPDRKHVFIIDEINRGNMSKIFGELLMLIESNKRDYKISLTYSDSPFFVPKNLYIIGMMNTADRSLAIIDYALRRRFCFFNLEPAFNSDSFKKYLVSQGASVELVNKIRTRMESINLDIEEDVNLGKGFKIGHSYFCDYSTESDWYNEVIKYEIEPLIREYWFDEEDKANGYVKELLR